MISLSVITIIILVSLTNETLSLNILHSSSAAFSFLTTYSNLPLTALDRANAESLISKVIYA